MCFVPKRCNDMMNVGRLQGFEVNSEDQSNSGWTFLALIFLISWLSMVDSIETILFFHPP